MEIRNNPFEDRASQTNKADITRPNRETIERANLDLHEKAARAAERRDSLEVDSNRVISERAERTASEADTDRAERVRELERAHHNGDLNSRGRIEQSAFRMLEGE
jgi:hypothetical protein